MLNDLLAIERGLMVHGAGRHPDINDMAKGWALRVRLGADGRVTSVEIVREAGRGVLWTLRNGKKNGFPGLKTATGLLRLGDQARAAHALAWGSAKTPADRRSELLRLIDNNPIDTAQVATWPNTGHRKRIRERLGALLPMKDDPLTSAVPAIFERFLAALDGSPPFLQNLTAALAERVRTRGDEWLDPVRAALIDQITLTIDVAEDDFERDAGDPRQIEHVSRALSVSSHSEGGQTRPHEGEFPHPILPGLGPSHIFSRNRDIPSLTRYGRTGDASFQVDSDLVRRLSGAITALTCDDAKGRTWRLIPAETGDKRDLLVVGIADPRLRMADALADDSEVGGEAALKELGSRVIDQSKGVYEHDHPQSEVTILILRAVDPANRKTIYHRKTRPSEFWKAARRWQAATSNTPDWLGFPSPAKSKSEAVFRRPLYVAPLSITLISRIRFANGGRRRISVIGATAAAAFSLFLHEGDVGRCARGQLRLLTRRHETLLSALVAARAEGIDRLKYFDPKADLRRDALRSITWIGALLYHLGRSKELYMTDVAFRLGQLLETADIVHIGYCADLRGGDVPPNLLGNSVLAIAGADPERALAILESRIKPYLAWAKREERLRAKITVLRTTDAKTEEQKKGNRLSFAIRNAFYSVPRLKELVSDLRPIVAMRETNDSFKAELLLGYLAGLPPVQRANTMPDDRGNGPRNSSEGE